jgi:hypothetical protein
MSQSARREPADLVPETKYAKAGDLSIAYQVAGSGPIDLVIVPGVGSHVELFSCGGRAAARIVTRVY